VDYTLRFSEPGSYQFACLIHPPMVGTVNVTG
jgi:plastocyanin